MHRFLIMTSAATLVVAPLALAPAIGAETASIHRSYDVAAFDSVAAAGSNVVLVKVGPAFSVSADGPAESLDKFKVEVKDGRLRIEPKEKHWHDEDWSDYEPATFHVTLPSIEAATLAGSGTMTVDRIKGDSFSASIAGSGTLELGSLSVDSTNFSIAGSGDIVAHGSSRKSSVSIAGSGDVKARDMATTTASISVVGSGDAELTVHDSAQISIMGSGDVDIVGTDNCTVSRMGGGKARCSKQAV